MDKNRCREHVAELLPGLLWAFQLQQWHVNVHYVEQKAVNPRFVTAGLTWLEPLYKAATIELVFDAITSRGALATVLAHELGHVLIAEMRTQMDLRLRSCPGARASEALDNAFLNATERVVMGFERMFEHGLGLKPLQLARRGATQRKKVIREDGP